MNLTTIGPLGFLLGLAALAGGLFLLQRLRVRHREIVVVTTMFWREALDEQRARTLVERFRHPLTYLLVLAIASLIWLGVARPDSFRAEGTRHVFLLDAAGTDRVGLDASKVALVEALEDAPRDRTEVLVCGEFVSTVLAPGEDRALVRERLARVEAVPAPSSIERAIRVAADEASGPTRIVLFGNGAVSAASSDRLPEDVTLSRARTEVAPSTGPRIVSLGVAPAASGEWGRVDVRAEILAGEDDVIGFEHGGMSLSPTRTSESGPGFRAYEFRDRPADGGTFALTNIAPEGTTHVLPDLPEIRVALRGAGLAEIRDVLQLDPAIEIVSETRDADVVIGEPAAGRPALALVPARDQTEAILIGHERSVDSDDALASAVGSFGLDRVDATELATRLGRPIAIGAAPADVRTVSLWTDLLKEEAGFVSSRAFPVLVGRSVRWLADVSPVVPYRAAGRPVPSRLDAPSRAPELAMLDSGGASIDGSARPGRELADLPGVEASSPGPWRPYTWVLVFALLLLGVEWFLFSRGRVA